jgi:hypothetical protein
VVRCGVGVGAAQTGREAGAWTVTVTAYVCVCVCVYCVLYLAPKTLELESRRDNSGPARVPCRILPERSLHLPSVSFPFTA